MFKILLARQGQTMEQGTLVGWTHPLGDEVAIGQELYEIETEKAIVPIEATRPGRIVRHVVLPGETAQVGALLAIAAEPGEEVTAAQIDAMVREGNDTGASPLSVAPVAATSTDAPRPPAKGRVAVIPKARALARELGVDLENVKGTGPDGTILPDDVRRALNSGSEAPAAKAVSSVSHGSGRRVPLSPIARSTVAALERAWQVPQFTQGIHVDASALVRSKSESAEQYGYMDFFIDAIVRAAREVPQAVSRLADRDIQHFDTIDVTIATATDMGLLIPVLRDAGALAMTERAKAWRAIVSRARQGKLTADESSGGTLALSNLGTRGVDYGTPLLPFGHAAIVFVGSLEKRAMVVDERVEARQSLHVSITYDHRVIDGVLGSQFTAALRDALLAPAA